MGRIILWHYSYFCTKWCLCTKWCFCTKWCCIIIPLWWYYILYSLVSLLLLKSLFKVVWSLGHYVCNGTFGLQVKCSITYVDTNTYLKLRISYILSCQNDMMLNINFIHQKECISHVCTFQLVPLLKRLQLVLPLLRVHANVMFCYVTFENNIWLLSDV